MICNPDQPGAGILILPRRTRRARSKYWPSWFKF